VDPAASRAALVALLRLACSGERAAAFAYRGHGLSVADPGERERIRAIEAEEWHHRRLVRGMLRSLGSGPDPRRERRAARVGRVLCTLSRCSGWLAPMFGAGALESRNVREYEDAARHARDCGRGDLVDCLLRMAEVEWEHEAWFRSRVLSHPVGRLLPLWKAPPPLAEIRGSFAREAGSAPPLRSPAPPAAAPVARTS
jgi:rubrerythrin